MTPLEQYPQLAEAIGLPDLYFKREDLHTYGSHKGRSIPVMVDRYYDAGDREFSISSSGNAALAAALHVQDLNNDLAEPISLQIYVGNHIAAHKLEKLEDLVDDNIQVLLKERPLQALTQAVQDGRRSLRQSTDDAALIGYESLAQELEQANGADKISAVFIGTSSGTTAQALADYFSKKKIPIQVHIVQTSSCHPLSDTFGTYEGPDEQSIADAIVDQTAQRKSALTPLIKKTGGTGWFATNEDILLAQQLVKKHTDLDISTNSALSVAGAMQAATMGYEIDGAVVCMICGE